MHLASKNEHALLHRGHMLLQALPEPQGAKQQPLDNVTASNQAARPNWPAGQGGKGKADEFNRQRGSGSLVSRGNINRSGD